jgi:hypothetical protein
MVGTEMWDRQSYREVMGSHRGTVTTRALYTRATLGSRRPVESEVKGCCRRVEPNCTKRSPKAFSALWHVISLCQVTDTCLSLLSLS